MSKPKSYVQCPKCKGESHRVYDKDQIEKAYPNDIRTQIAMKREYICSKCGNVFPISLKETARAFREKRYAEGKKDSDIVKELTNFTKEKMRETIDEESKRDKDVKN